MSIVTYELQLSSDRILAALYAPEGGGVRPMGLPAEVLASLRAGVGLGRLEAAAEATGRVSLAEAWLSQGQVLTAVCPAYPARLLRVMGRAAPAVFWSRGLGQGIIPSDQRWVAVVGTRAPAPEDFAPIQRFVKEAAELGFGVVSGGALGVDALARREALRWGIPILEFLPCGLEMSFGAGPGRGGSRPAPVQCSAWPALAEFSTLRAMLRNAFIYASAEVALVVHPRYRQGGSWHGAVTALRERTTQVLVASPADCPAGRALCGAGAAAVRPGLGLAEALKLPPLQPALFEATG